MVEKTKENIISPELSSEPEEIIIDNTLRPRKWSEFLGQKKVKRNLEILIAAAKKRDEPVDHILLYGPPGIGKTTLANVIAYEMGVSIRTTSGPAIERAGDLASILTNLAPGDILFIDEIHRLNKLIEEVLYPAMEEFKLDIIIGKGPSAQTLRLDLPKFTLIGATTKIASLSSPLRDRFGVIERLSFYSEEEIGCIIKRSASILKVKINPCAVAELAKRTRRTPRIANRLLKRVRDFAVVEREGEIDLETTQGALKLLEIDELGLDEVDREILMAIALKFGGGPVGLEALASASREDKDTIEDVYEPYLMQIGFIDRTPRGRVLTKRAYEHLGLESKESSEQNKLV